MAKAVKCPVCGGEGEVTDEPNGYDSTTSFPLPKKTCHGCGGKGWVEVAEDYSYAGAIYRKENKEKK